MEIDQLQPFLLNEAPVRGRVVRLGETVNAILSRHDYAPPVARLLAEALTISALLSSNLKQQGILTLQLQSEGPVRSLLVDATFDGSLRGMAKYEAGDLPDSAQASLPQLCRNAQLVITLDPGGGGQRYQGIVALSEASLSDSMQSYFQQSQQLQVQLMTSVGEQIEQGQSRWIAGGIYIEHMPEDEQHIAHDPELWNEATTLLTTLRDDELLDTHLPLPDLLHRLYHERGVWVYEPLEMRDQCRCSRDRMLQALQQMPADELKELSDEGVLTADCHFCNRQESFTLDEIALARAV